MKLDGTAVQYLLLRQFKSVDGYNLTSRLKVDYPILYDVFADMSGHTVLVPEHERPGGHDGLENVLCICVGDESAKSAREAGLPVLRINDDVAFQHLYNAMQAVFVRNERLDARLRAYVDTYAGFKPLIEACAEDLHYACTLVDERYQIICAVDAKGEAAKNDVSGTFGSETLDSKSIDLFMASRIYQRLRSTKNVFALPGSDDLFMKNVFVGKRLVGALIVRHASDILSARYARFVLNYLCPFVEEMYAKLGSFGLVASGYEQVRKALEAYVDGGFAPGDAKALQGTLLESGHDSETPFIIVRIERSFTNEGVEDHAYIARRFESAFSHSHCFELDGALFMLADLGMSGSDVIGDILIAARDNLSKVGISRPFEQIDDLEAACAQASAALSCGNAIDHMNWCYRFADYALPWAVSHGVAGAPNMFARHPAVETLARYDGERGTDLLHTLSTFARCRYNATIASEKLFVARSTLLNRLKRIQELTDVDLEDFEQRVYLGLSLIASER